MEQILHTEIESILISEQEIRNKIQVLGNQISRDYEDKNPVLISILKGSFIFLADLVRMVTIPITIDFMSVASYEGTSSRGKVEILKDIDEEIKDRHVLIVEDIIDTGITLSEIISMFHSRSPASLKICALLNKTARRQSGIDIDFEGFNIPDKFVVGYGMDYNQQYRHLPYIGVLKRDLLSKESKSKK